MFFQLLHFNAIIIIIDDLGFGRALCQNMTLNGKKDYFYSNHFVGKTQTKTIMTCYMTKKLNFLVPTKF